MARRQRLDAEMVRRGLVESRTEASRAIDDRRVLVNGAMADKAARQVSPGDALVLNAEGPQYVSRGGHKLAAALGSFDLDVTGWRLLDAGASTGGFTDCLLQHGAAHVVALDVGHGQLHPRVRNDPRVTVLERFHVRDVTTDVTGGHVHGVTADLSFISLTRVLDALVRVCAPGGHLVLLVKPQFEAGRVEVARGHGVITDPLIHDRVRAELCQALTDHRCTVLGWIDSPLVGAEGNREFLVHATTERPGFAQ